MLAHYLPGVGQNGLLDPDSPAWQGVPAEELELVGTPVGLQPTPAIMVAWANKPIGAVHRVRVAVVHDGNVIAFRLEWADDTDNNAIRDTTEFSDAAAVLIRVHPQAPMGSMGAPTMQVNPWYWRADEDGRGRQLLAEGIGTSRTVDREQVRGRGIWKDGRWTVVISRALRVQSSEPVAQLTPGEVTGFGVAVWEGSHSERAGIKAYSIDWHELSLAVPPTARR